MEREALARAESCLGLGLCGWCSIGPGGFPMLPFDIAVLCVLCRARRSIACLCVELSLSLSTSWPPQDQRQKEINDVSSAVENGSTQGFTSIGHAPSNLRDLCGEIARDGSVASGRLQITQTHQPHLPRLSGSRRSQQSRELVRRPALSLQATGGSTLRTRTAVAFEAWLWVCYYFLPRVLESCLGGFCGEEDRGPIWMKGRVVRSPLRRCILLENSPF